MYGPISPLKGPSLGSREPISEQTRRSASQKQRVLVLAAPFDLYLANPDGLRVQGTKTWGIYGFYIRNCNNGFGNMEYIYIYMASILGLVNMVLGIYSVFGYLHPWHDGPSTSATRSLDFCIGNY